MLTILYRLQSIIYLSQALSARDPPWPTPCRLDTITPLKFNVISSFQQPQLFFNEFTIAVLIQDLKKTKILPAQLARRTTAPQFKSSVPISNPALPSSISLPAKRPVDPSHQPKDSAPTKCRV